MELQESQRRAIMQQYPGFYRLTAVVILIGVGILIGWILFADKDGYGMNLFTEFVGIGFTYLIVDWLVRRRDENQQRAKLKDELLDDFGSDDNPTAKRAANRLRKEQWLFDGSMEGQSFRGANLEGAKLWKANLERADLGDSNLNNADLYDCNLAGCYLDGSKLRNADMRRTNLTHARIFDADLENANLGSTALYNADLRGSNLKGAKLWNTDLFALEIDEKTQFDTNTMLPDGEYWSSNEDLQKFIDGIWKPKKARIPGHSSKVRMRF